MAKFMEERLECVRKKYMTQSYSYISVSDVERVKFGRRWKFMAKCTCICGKVFTARVEHLDTDIHCGCMSDESEEKRSSRRLYGNLIGERRGFLEVTNVVGYVENQLWVECTCDCGHSDMYIWSNVKLGRANKCKYHFKKLRGSDRKEQYDVQ